MKKRNSNIRENVSNCRFEDSSFRYASFGMTPPIIIGEERAAATPPLSPSFLSERPSFRTERSEVRNLRPTSSAFNFHKFASSGLFPFVVILLITFLLENSYGQTVTFNLPEQKGKTLHLLACKGVERDTVLTGKINEKGALLFSPSNDKPLTSGVVTLFIAPDILYDFIYSDKENSTLHSFGGEYIHTQNTHIHHSPENDFMDSKYREQMARLEKLMFLDQGLQLYKPGEKIYTFLREEKSRLEQEQVAFEAMLQQERGGLYAARLLALQNLINNDVSRLEVTSDTAEYALIRERVIRELDTETLYRSGLWFACLNGMLELYYKQSPFYSRFGEDMVRLLKRTGSQEVIQALVNDAKTICNQYSWNIDEETLSIWLMKKE